MHAPGLGGDDGAGRKRISHHVKIFIRLRDSGGGPRGDDPLKERRHGTIQAKS